MHVHIVYECVQYLQMSRLVTPSTSTTGGAGAPGHSPQGAHGPGTMSTAVATATAFMLSRFGLRREDECADC